MIAVVIITETLICVKFGRNQFPSPIPRNVVIFWSIFTTSLVLFPVWQFWLRYKLFGVKQPIVEVQEVSVSPMKRSSKRRMVDSKLDYPNNNVKQA